jgi:hypothetical protein
VSASPGYLLLLLAGNLAAQSVPSEDTIDRFVRETREATARYRDQAAALAAGYRPIGPDFPSMGEHWLNRAIIMEGRVDPARPPILEYITIQGQPVLAGVAYARLAYGVAPATAIPAGTTAWHYHAGSVDEESFIASHASGGHGSAETGPRIAVLHAWVWFENPAGLFATDNWALPWGRVGMSPPAGHTGPMPATLTAALASGGERYFTSLLRIRNGLDSTTAASVETVLQRRAALLRQEVFVRSERPDAVRLATLWTEIERELMAACPACTIHPLIH